MIDELEVRDYALIARANLEFSPGFTVLTGETGAGKTALVGAIKLLIGERADVTAIADGADELRVSARLIEGAAGEGAAGEGTAGGGAAGEGAAGGGTAGGGAAGGGTEIVVSRRLNRAGRSRASIDGEMVAVGVLAERIGPRFDLLGQHEHQSLLTPSAQLAYLDRFGGDSLQAALSSYREAWATRQAAADELASLEAAAELSSRSLEDARFAIATIEPVAPLAGEYEQLQDELPILRRGEDLALGSDTAWQLMREEGQALDLLAQAARVLNGIKGIDARLDGLSERLDSALIDLEDIAAELVSYRDSVSFDAEALEGALDRLGQLEGLMRRFGPGMDDVLALLDESRRQLAVADNLPELLAAAQQSLAGCEAELATAAARLAEERSSASARLADGLTARLADLAFSGAAIEARLDDLEREAWTSSGSQRFELLFTPQPRATPRPLARIASGGELSRAMLALKSELLADEGLTLVFDEVDAGIGGQAARAVADHLRRLADLHQVIVVTHLAQIAAVADRQYVVEKVAGEAGERSDGDPAASQATAIYEVTGEARVLEIARMLSGSDDDTALAHARELLNQ